MFIIDGEKRGDVINELTEIIDPTWNLEDYVTEDISGVSCIEGLSENNWMQDSALVYLEGEFYANVS